MSYSADGQEEALLKIDPMHQFEVYPLFSDSSHVGFFSFTNSALWSLISVFLVCIFFFIALRKVSLFPHRMQCVAEIVFEFVLNMVKDFCGEAGVKYFPYIFTLFMFVFLANVIAMVPYSFSVTSHMAITGFLAVCVFVSVTVIGFVRNGMGFLKLFVPEGAPLAFKPFLSIIELISYFVRPMSQSIRLCANMIAGHAMVKVFAGFASVVAVYGVGVSTSLVSVGSIAVLVGIIALELLVACIQAYVFAVLTCVYLNDALNMH